MKPILVSNSWQSFFLSFVNTEVEDKNFLQLFLCFSLYFFKGFYFHFLTLFVLVSMAFFEVTIHFLQFVCVFLDFVSRVINFLF